MSTDDYVTFKEKCYSSSTYNNITDITFAFNANISLDSGKDVNLF